MIGQFLITYDFWSRVGFFVSYLITSFLILEVVRLVYTDVNKRNVERFLESYSRSRTASTSPPPSKRKQSLKKIPIDDLAVYPRTPARRTTSPAVASSSEKTLVNEARVRRSHSTAQVPTLATLAQATAPAAAANPGPRRLRKRSDTVSSAGSVLSRRSSREKRSRDVSPSSSKASSRHGSPRPRTKDAQKLTTTLQKMMKAKA